MTKSLSAVLFAGGESRRMGADKATLHFGGKPLWQHQVNLLRQLQLSEILVSARIDPVWRPNDIDLVLDTTGLHGPLSGLAAALARSRTSHLLALAIDMPFMTADYLRSLGTKIQPDSGVVPMIANRAEPLAAIYPAKAIAHVCAALRGPDFSLQHLVKQLLHDGKLHAVPVGNEERRLFRNLNAPGDLSSTGNHSGHC
jgi:molybdopterin-guanine dinucleotide biosynthesis protein A